MPYPCKALLFALAFIGVLDAVAPVVRRERTISAAVSAAGMHSLLKISKRSTDGCASDRYSESACKDAATEQGYITTGENYTFSGLFATTGCYAYISGEFKGRAYYGKLPQVAEEALKVNGTVNTSVNTSLKSSAKTNVDTSGASSVSSAEGPQNNLQENSTEGDSQNKSDATGVDVSNPVELEGLGNAREDGKTRVVGYGCCAYTEAACKSAAAAMGLQVGGPDLDFSSSDYTTTGCYAYAMDGSKYDGYAYYGKIVDVDVQDISQLTPVDSSKGQYRIASLPEACMTVDAPSSDSSADSSPGSGGGGDDDDSSASSGPDNGRNIGHTTNTTTTTTTTLEQSGPEAYKRTANVGGPDPNDPNAP